MRDAFQATTEGVVFAKADFNKYQSRFIEHDDVNFTTAAAKVFVDQF